MIKCNVSVYGTVSKAAVVRNGKDGMPFTTYSIDVVVPAKKGINKTVIVSCIMDGDDSEGIVVGNRIELKGVLTFKKKDDNLYFNVKVSEVNLSPVSESKDGIVGDMEFKGKIGKYIDMKKDKNGKAFLMFSVQRRLEKNLLLHGCALSVSRKKRKNGCSRKPPSRQREGWKSRCITIDSTWAARWRS